MSPIHIEDLERQLGPVLTRRAERVSIPSAHDGRVAIDRRLAQRARHRRIVRVSTVVLVLALIAAGIGLSRRQDTSVKVISGTYTPVPPLPRLAWPARVGTTSLASLYPGIQEVMVLHHGGKNLHLDIVLSDLPLATIRAGHVVGPVKSMPTVVQGHPAFAVTVRPCCSLSPGLYWKPDADHVAGLELDQEPGDTLADATARTTALADQLVAMAEDPWWHLVSRPTASVDFGPTGNTRKVPYAALTDRPARLGLPDGRSIPLDYQSSGQLHMVLDVPGYPTGTFHLMTGLMPLGGSQFLGPHDPSAVKVRGTIGQYQFGGKDSGRIAWIDHGLGVALTFGPPTDPQAASTESTLGSHGRLPTEKVAIAVANELTTLSESEWHSIWLPSALRTDVVVLPAPRRTECLDWGACPLRFLGVAAPTTTTR
jgi:hypothetical protein